MSGPSIQSFAAFREAKEFLIDRILAQAAGSGVSLSEVERKMLYFSETAWTLLDMSEVSAEFDRDYDQDDYEKKIGAIVRSLEDELAQSPAASADWDAAVQVLSSEDHYLIVLIGAANDSEKIRKRPPGDFAWLILTAAAVIAVLMTCMWLLDRH
jgi:hypothetical protein